MDIENYHLLEIKEQLNRIERILIDGVTTNIWLNIKETATYCSLSVSTLRRAVQRGTLKVSRRTGKLLFHRKDIDRYLKG